MEADRRCYDGERFRALALYLAARSINDPAFGKEKLARLLFYCDYIACGEIGDTITGATYTKYPQGPYPEGLDRELCAITDTGAGVLVPADAFQREERLVAVHRADASPFSGPEVSVIERVLQALLDEDSARAARLSWFDSTWEDLDDWAAIPCELAFTATGPVSEEAVRIGREVAERLEQVASAQ